MEKHRRSNNTIKEIFIVGLRNTCVFFFCFPQKNTPLKTHSFVFLPKAFGGKGGGETTQRESNDGFFWGVIKPRDASAHDALCSNAGPVIASLSRVAWFYYPQKTRRFILARGLSSSSSSFSSKSFGKNKKECVFNGVFFCGKPKEHTGITESY